MNDILLTSLSHGGGCGCKIAPSVLEELLKDLPLFSGCKDLLVGAEYRDDAAVYLLNENQAVVATTDFFMPIVNDPRTFGRIAAVNAISDIYAMGAAPLFALSITALPVKKLSVNQMKEILSGGMDICREAGIPLAGGHSIDSEEPIYGLAVIGLAHPDNIKRNNGAKPGDALILGKPVGIGILSHVLKNKSLSDSAYEKMIRYTTRLNTPGIQFGAMKEVHAMTDVTGFGLAGHTLEICRASNTSGQIYFEKIPFIKESLEYAKNGEATGASGRNKSSYENSLKTFRAMEDWQMNLLTDPQTSGGLLISTSQENANKVLEVFHKEGFPEAAVIGQIIEKKDGEILEILY